MEEAQELADRVAVMTSGRIVAEGPPSRIGGRATALTRISFALPDGCTAADLPVHVTGPPAAGGGLVTVDTAEPTAVLHRLTGWALGRGTVLRQLTVERPSLEDIYLRLTAPDRAAGQEGSTR
jgi:ABC-2 type transport system ATP-binding protein